MNRRGETIWVPESSHSSVNLDHVNEDDRFLGTVRSTARILNWLNEGFLTEECFVDGLSKNAKHLGLSEELLLDLAHTELQEQKSTPVIAD